MNERNQTSARRVGRKPRWGVIAILAIVVGGGAAAVADGVGNNETTTISADEIEARRAELAEQIPNATRAQRAVLIDGVVDRSEMSELANNASDCSVANGSRAIDHNVGEKGVEWTVNFRAGEDIDTMMAETDKCWFEHIGLAEQYYSLQNIPSVEEQVRYNDAVIECLSSDGINAVGWPVTDVKIDPAIESQCVDEAEGW